MRGCPHMMGAQGMVRLLKVMIVGALHEGGLGCVKVCRVGRAQESQWTLSPDRMLSDCDLLGFRP